MEKGRGRNYLRIVLLIGLLSLSVVAVRVVWSDPLWLWRDTPPWVAQHGGHNRVFDTHMRRAKALQVVARQPETVILGASGVYRGMDTSAIPGREIYNLGISSLRIAEAEAYTEFLIRWTPVRRLAIGLRFWMFDSEVTSRPGFEPDLAKPVYLLSALPAAFITGRAWDDVEAAMGGKGKGDGLWNRLGFKTTNPRSAKDIRRVLDSYHSFRISEVQYANLERMLDRLVEADIEVTVFVSPQSQPYLEKLTELGDLESLATWRDRVSRIVKERDFAFFDLSENNPFSSEPLPNGSTEHWIDSSHYQPVVGRWILEQVGMIPAAGPAGHTSEGQSSQGN